MSSDTGQVPDAAAAVPDAPAPPAAAAAVVAPAPGLKRPGGVGLTIARNEPYNIFADLDGSFVNGGFIVDLSDLQFAPRLLGTALP